MLDKPLRRRERDNTIDLLRGCVNRICVTDDKLELVRLMGSANYYISRLAENRILELENQEIDDFLKTEEA